MPIYVVIDPANALSGDVASHFDQSDRCEVTSNGWLVRSSRLTSAEVAADLNIASGANSGIVVTAEHYAGRARSEIVEKLAAWQAGA